MMFFLLFRLEEEKAKVAYPSPSSPAVMSAVGSTPERTRSPPPLSPLPSTTCPSAPQSPAEDVSRIRKDGNQKESKGRKKIFSYVLFLLLFGFFSRFTFESVQPRAFPVDDEHFAVVRLSLLPDAMGTEQATRLNHPKSTEKSY